MGGSNTVLRSCVTFALKSSMAPMKAMKAMKGGSKAMTKGGLAEALATETELKKSECMKVVNSLADIATQHVKSAGIFTIHGLCRIKTRMKPATKAGKREIFGKEVMVKAKPARTIVKAYPVAALKSNF